MAKYQGKYRITSTRLKDWDYGKNGAYFITICTYDRMHFFGEILNSKMQLNEVGKLAEQYWLEILQMFPYTELANFVIMPNHVHGILVIDKKMDGDGVDGDVETRLIASLHHHHHPRGGITKTKNPMLHQNISRIIRWYKGRCTFEMRKINPEFRWQTRFHDHIIRNEKSFENIQKYILNNPSKWGH